MQCEISTFIILPNTAQCNLHLHLLPATFTHCSRIVSESTCTNSGVVFACSTGMNRSGRVSKPFSRRLSWLSVRCFGHLLIPGDVVGESGAEDAIEPQDGEGWRIAIVAVPIHRQPVAARMLVLLLDKYPADAVRVIIRCMKMRKASRRLQTMFQRHLNK
jgi:hypothetical protein